MDADEPLLLDVSEKKFARAAEGRRGFTRAWIRVLCVRARRAFPETVLRSLRIFNQRKFEYKILVVFVRHFLSGWKRSQLVDSKPSNATEKQIQLPLNYTECPLQYGKKEGDNSLVAWRELFKTTREIRFIRVAPVGGAHRVLDGETGEKLIKLQCT